MTRIKGERHQRFYVTEENKHEVFPIDCVPAERTQKGWTLGVKAWDKINGNDVWVGWFTAPRKKQKSKQYGLKKSKTNPYVVTRKVEGEKTRVVNEGRLRRQMWGDPQARSHMLREQKEAGELEKITNIVSSFDSDETILIGEEE